MFRQNPRKGLMEIFFHWSYSKYTLSLAFNYIYIYTIGIWKMCNQLLLLNDVKCNLKFFFNNFSFSPPPVPLSTFYLGGNVNSWLDKVFWSMSCHDLMLRDEKASLWCEAEHIHRNFYTSFSTHPRPSPTWF